MLVTFYLLPRPVPCDFYLESCPSYLQRQADIWNEKADTQ